MAAETVIESFCERCGTRYTFEPVRKRESMLVGLGKQLGILMEDHAAGLAQRDPFHGTFHFCLECRQYTCPRCWNEAAGFCLGCMPLPGAPDTAALDAAEAEAGLEAAVLRDEATAEHELLGAPEAWPDADLLRRRAAAEAWPEAALAAERTATVPADEVSAESAAEDASVVEPEDEAWSLTFEPEPLAEVAVIAEVAADGEAIEPLAMAEGAEWDELESDAGLDIAALAAAAEVAGSVETVADADPMAESMDATDGALLDEVALDAAVAAVEEPQSDDADAVWFDEAADAPAEPTIIALGAPAEPVTLATDDDASSDDDRMGLIGLAAVTGALLVEEALDARDDTDTELDVEDAAEPEDAASLLEPEPAAADAADAMPVAVDGEAVDAAELAIEPDDAGAEWDLAETEEATATSTEPEGLTEADTDAVAEMADDAMAETVDIAVTAEAEPVAEMVAAPTEDLSLERLADEAEAEDIAADLDAVELAAAVAIVADEVDEVVEDVAADTDTDTEAVADAAEAAGVAVVDAEAVQVEAMAADAMVVAAAEPESVPVAAVVADADDEADWADLISHLPPSLDDEPSADEWAAMAPSLGPDIAPSPDPVAPVIPAAPAPAPAPAPSVAWQLTPPVSETEPRATAWPPLGPVFRPAPTPPPAAPHPSVLAPRPGTGGVLARGQAAGAAPSALPNGVRPCRNCELPLSASARFCRRCGRPQG